MSANPREAYESIEKATLSGRDLEASVLSRASAMLSDVQQRWDEPDRDKLLDHVLRHNQRVWTLFQSELMDESNPLPVEIKRNLMALSNFIDKRTVDILVEPERAKLDALITINQNIAAGLRGSA
ncbi:MAG: flagellar biosynthesis regulator FlaF [Planctomycetes bacterium]|nr:flagellar biosynthesis regulator FlaF [Planctomycetota bacterium]